MVLRKMFGWLSAPTEQVDPSQLTAHEDQPPSLSQETSQWTERQREPVNELPTERELVTSTATIVVYDLAALAHRMDDDVDWWADAEPELEELNKRNLLIIGVQADGFYDVEVSLGEPADHRKFSLTFPSGTVFIGPGEVMTGGGGQPNGQDGGFIISVEPGDHVVSVRRVDDERISIALNRSAPFENDAREPVRV